MGVLSGSKDARPPKTNSIECNFRPIRKPYKNEQHAYQTVVGLVSLHLRRGKSAVSINI